VWGFEYSSCRIGTHAYTFNRKHRTGFTENRASGSQGPKSTCCVAAETCFINLTHQALYDNLRAFIKWGIGLQIAGEFGWCPPTAASCSGVTRQGVVLTDLLSLLVGVLQEANSEGRERERSLLTIKKWLKVGKHNALLGHTASGRDGESPFGLMARLAAAEQGPDIVVVVSCTSEVLFSTMQ